MKKMTNMTYEAMQDVRKEAIEAVDRLAISKDMIRLGIKYFDKLMDQDVDENGDLAQVLLKINEAAQQLKVLVETLGPKR